MTTVVRCPCGNEVKVPSEYLGKKGRCPACKEVFRMTVTEAPPSPPPFEPPQNVEAAQTSSSNDEFAVTPSLSDGSRERRKDAQEEALRRAKVAAEKAAVVTGHVAKEGAALSRAGLRWAWPRLRRATVAAWKWVMPRVAAVLRTVFEATRFAVSGAGREAMGEWWRLLRARPHAAAWSAVRSHRVRVLTATACVLVAGVWFLRSDSRKSSTLAGAGGSNAWSTPQGRRGGLGGGNRSLPSATTLDVRREWPKFSQSSRELVERSRYASVMLQGNTATAGATSEDDEATLLEFIAVSEIVTGQKWQGDVSEFGVGVRKVADAILRTNFARNDLPGVSVDRSGWVEALSLRGAPHEELILENLPKLRHLQWLDLSGLDAEQLGESSLACLAECPTLEYLNLGGLMVNERTMSHIATLPKLRMLVLSASRVNDRGIAELEGLESLEELWVDYTRVTPRGLAALSDLPRLDTIFALPNRYSLSESVELLSDLEGDVALQPLCDLEIKSPPSSRWSPHLRLVLGERVVHLGVGPLGSDRVETEARRHWENYVPPPLDTFGQPLARGVTGPSRRRWQFRLLPVEFTAQGIRGGSARGGIPDPAGPSAPQYDWVDPEKERAEQRRLNGPPNSYLAPPRNFAEDEGATDVDGKEVLQHLAKGWDADTEWVSLARFRGPGQKTSFAQVACDDDDLACFSELENLRALDLSGWEISGEGLKYLANCKQLRFLNLSGTKFSDDGIRYVIRNCPELTMLRCINTELTAEGVKQLESELSRAVVVTESGGVDVEYCDPAWR